MKKILCLLSLVLLTYLSVNAQKASNDSSHKDSIKTFAIVLNESELNALMVLLKTADEKPSVLVQWINFINSRIQLIQPPEKKDQLKK